MAVVASHFLLPPLCLPPPSSRTASHYSVSPKRPPPIMAASSSSRLSRIRSTAEGEVDSWSSRTSQLRTEILWWSSCQRWRRALTLIYFLVLSRQMFSTMRTRVEPPKRLSMSDPALTPRRYLIFSLSFRNPNFNLQSL
ncbi:hypothetical protein CK203_078457 [Vitis vinifera]|uniref:Uncharacterized protein n=1 Tax=Vitis vinifera TaxID=29760 RepID=A0A438F5T9_VITVI|nr:hypothetical protein CK203_078457 [Vitis vinifera]